MHDPVTPWTDRVPAIFTACFMFTVVGLLIGYGLWGPT